MDTEQTPAGSSSPALPALTLNSTARVRLGLLSGADAGLSSPFSFSGLSASAHRPTAALPRKRGIQTEQHEPRAKEPRTQDPQDSQDDDPNSLARSKILEARDLLLQACSLTKSRDEQSRLLDLLEVFREYTEKGKLAKSSNIIASQVASLETAVRKIETKAKTLASTTLPPALPLALAPRATPGPSKPASYASVASKAPNSTEWTTVERSKKPTKAAATTTRKKPKDKRLILITAPGTQARFSPLALRNAFNKAFLDKGVKGPVVATVAKSLGQNIVVTTTDAFSAEYLLEKRAIWEHIYPFTSAQKDEPWHKVIVHGIPTTDFNTPNGMDLIIDEIKTFNKGFTPVGTPYWITPKDKRAVQLAGSVAIAFATAKEANRAIRHRLYIGGISVRVEKLYSTAPTSQCRKCQGFGHLESYCKRAPSCRLCGDKHATPEHACNTCNTKGTKCQHLAPKCSNCKEAHTADSKECQVLLAIKTKKATTTTL
jgi:hypothetical protein